MSLRKASSDGFGFRSFFAAVVLTCITLLFYNVYCTGAAEIKAAELRRTVPLSFVRSSKDHIVRITFVSKDKDTFTAIEPDGTFRTYSIAAIAKTVDEIIAPGNQNYANYAHMFPKEATAEAFRMAGPNAMVLMADGSVVAIINPTYQPGLAIVSKSVGTRQTLSTDEIASQAVNIVSASKRGNALEAYDDLAGYYVSGTKLKSK